MAKAVYRVPAPAGARRGGEPLKIALIYSFAPNEADPGEQGFVDDEDFPETAGLTSHRGDFLDARDLRLQPNVRQQLQHGTPTSSRTIQGLCLRLKNRDLDMSIVVNMLLTGFDATTLHTLWVDKNLKQHG